MDYGEIRPWFQRVRAVAAATFLVALGIGALYDAPSVWLPAAMALLVMMHALVRGRVPHAATESLVIDALAIGIGLVGSEHAHTPLVAAMAYLIAASITFGGVTAMIGSLCTFAFTIAVRPLLPIPNPLEITAAGKAITWLAVLVFLAAVALSLTAAASAVHRTRGKQSDALEAVRKAADMKNQFVSMITHELRTPLTNISGFAETLAESWGDLPAEDVNEFLQIIVSESDHLKNLVEDVLAIPRLEAGRLLLETTEFQLRPAAFKVANLLFPDGGDRSASVSIGGNVMVDADPNRVEQILRNLLENARKYGGDQVSVEAIARGNEWQVAVSDTGPGLAVQDRERVFGAFEQATSGDSRTESGFGLGLAVAKNLVEAMGGRIWYEPGFPVGARFCFTLPAAKAKAPGATRSEVA